VLGSMSASFTDIITILLTRFHKRPQKTAEYEQPAQRASTHLCPQVLPIFARRVSSTSMKGKPHLNLNNSASLLFPRIKTTRSVGLHRKLEPQKPGRAPFRPARVAPAPPPAQVLGAAPPPRQDPRIPIGSSSPGDGGRAQRPFHSFSDSTRDSQSYRHFIKI
jgi:hypothetical protein